MEISETKTKSLTMCKSNSERAKTELNESITEQVSESKYFGSITSNNSTDRPLEYKVKVKQSR